MRFSGWYEIDGKSMIEGQEWGPIGIRMGIVVPNHNRLKLEICLP